MLPVGLTCVSRKRHADAAAQFLEEEPWTAQVVEETRTEGGVERAVCAEIGFLEIDLLHAHAFREAE